MEHVTPAITTPRKSNGEKMELFMSPVEARIISTTTTPFKSVRIEHRPPARRYRAKRSSGGGGGGGVQALREIPLNTPPRRAHDRDDKLSSKSQSLIVTDITPARQAAYPLKFKIKRQSEVLVEKVGNNNNGSSMLTAIVYDERCLHHRIPNEQDFSQERPDRLKQIWQTLQEHRLVEVCARVPCVPISMQDLHLTHSNEHLALLTNTHDRIVESGVEDKFEFVDEYNDTYMCSQSLMAARVAVGGLLSMCTGVMSGKQKNGFAVIRPPGHHACQDRVSGFCLVNNVACVTRVLQRRQLVRRIAIVDFDVHHGDGTQRIFYDDASVLFISIHRYDGKFFPRTGSYKEIGGDNAKGKTINIPLRKGSGDAEYLRVMRDIVVPVCKEFNADLMLVSAGFDAVDGDPLGGMHVSPICYGHITKLLMGTAPHGRLVMALEGGYEAERIANCTVHCIHALHNDKLPPLPNQNRKKLRNFTQLVERVQRIQAPYWKCLDASVGRSSKRIATATQVQADDASEMTKMFNRMVV